MAWKKGEPRSERDRTRISMAKRSKAERESDLVLIHRLRLQRVAPQKVLEMVNAVQVSRVAEALVEQGYPASQARQLAEDAKLTPQTISRDFRTVLARLKAGSQGGGEALILSQIHELELERQTLILVESKAWEMHEKGEREESAEHERLVPAEVQIRPECGHDPLRAAGECALCDDVRGSSRKVLKPAGLVRSSRTEPVTAQWLAQIVQCVALRFQILCKQGELALLLAAPPPLPFDLSELGNRRDAGAQLLAREVEFLYSVEARAAGKPVDQQRLRLLSALLPQVGMQLPANGSEDGGNGKPAATFTFGVRVIDVQGRIDGNG